MSRAPRMDPSMAAAMFGMQQCGAAGAFAMALVMYTLAPWQPPTAAALDAARAAAARFRVSDDLAEFMPQEPGRFAARARKDSYRGVVIALKQLDSLEGHEREAAIAEVRALLGAGGA